MHQHSDFTVIAEMAPCFGVRSPFSELGIPGMSPNVWLMPSRGIEWCDCGKHHVLDRDTIEYFAAQIVSDPEWMTHDEVIDTAMDLWNYVAVCEFFMMGIRTSASVVTGNLAPKYRYERGLEIVAYFSKTWQGCPEEICRSVHERED
ncbi:hypothetical protein CQ018_18535 [Arthrobacter sp. MYb227]|uniref:hypothetical protein n=1 Tax=Arthrobacter sp. MYb227 TaxID=1848601 RepID=UPI000CFC4E7D|nr:hypothetical protein [Arthrobacter sp. MYb227]PQZ86678.1 hypothetical protein CQ018_18535 [Arthrobacter sp. MYb227]